MAKKSVAIPHFSLNLDSHQTDFVLTTKPAPSRPDEPLKIVVRAELILNWMVKDDIQVIVSGVPSTLQYQYKGDYFIDYSFNPKPDDFGILIVEINSHTYALVIEPHVSMSYVDIVNDPTYKTTQVIGNPGGVDLVFNANFRIFSFHDGAGGVAPILDAAQQIDLRRKYTSPPPEIPLGGVVDAEAIYQIFGVDYAQFPSSQGQMKMLTEQQELLKKQMNKAAGALGSLNINYEELAQKILGAQTSMEKFPLLDWHHVDTPQTEKTKVISGDEPIHVIITSTNGKTGTTQLPDKIALHGYAQGLAILENDQRNLMTLDGMAGKLAAMPPGEAGTWIDLVEAQAQEMENRAATLRIAAIILRSKEGKLK